jgi:hypothetical protein
LLLVSVAYGAEPAFESGTSPFKVRDEAKQFAPTAVVRDDAITLRNRGVAVSKADYPAGATVSFSWKWTEGDLEKKYPDHLCVVVLTDGVLREKWSHEIAKGVLVRFNPGSGAVQVEGWLADKNESEQLASKDGFTFEKGKEYAVKIAYTPAKVVVTVDGGGPIEAAVPEKFRMGGKKICFYNREPVAGIVKESVLTKLSAEKK